MTSQALPTVATAAADLDDLAALNEASEFFRTIGAQPAMTRLADAFDRLKARLLAADGAPPIPGLVDDLIRWRALNTVCTMEPCPYPRLRDAFREWAANVRDGEIERSRASLAIDLADAPIIDSNWQHRNGRTYRVIAIANQKPRPGYEPTVVYQDYYEGSVYTRPVRDWFRSMTLLR